MPESATIDEVRERWPEWGEFPRRDIYPFPVERGIATIAEFEAAGIVHSLTLVREPSDKLPANDPTGWKARALWPDYRDEPVVRKGFALNVWDAPTSTRSSGVIITRPEELTLELALRLRDEAAARCRHPENEVLATGNCYSRLRCKVCGDVWEIDSSG